MALMAATFEADYNEATDREDWRAACVTCHDSTGPFETEQPAVDWSDNHRCDGWSQDGRDAGGWRR